MRVIARRIAAVTAMAVAPALIALGAATASQAQPTSVVDNGPSISHPAFPHQDNFPQPGSREHHRHQWNRAR